MACVEGAGHGCPSEPDAELDPWTLVDTEGEPCLFGFALRHPATGGLAWTLSTPLVHLDTNRRRATTRSGRRYALGRRIHGSALPDQEARIAFALLVRPPAETMTDDVLAGISEDLARGWLTSCKAARHLDVQPPSLDEEAVTQFLAQYGRRYVATVQSRRSI